MKSKESHNLDVMHLGCCTGCGGTHIIPTQFTQPAGVDIHLAWQDEYNTIFDSLPKHTPEVKGYSREQVDAIKDVLIKSKGALEYAAFNYDGSKLENLRPGLLDSTGVSDSCLISVREINHLLSSLPTPSTDEQQ